MFAFPLWEEDLIKSAKRKRIGYLFIEFVKYNLINEKANFKKSNYFQKF